MSYKNHNQNDLRVAIIELIAFFDKFDFPLTSFEVWRYLSVKMDYLAVVKALETLSIAFHNQPNIQKNNGFYFLFGREKIIQTRMKRYNYANRKLKKAIFFARLFKYIPWVRLVAVGNIIGPNNMRNSGDIDFFIIAEQNRIWMTRAFCVIIAKIFRARPRINFPISKDNTSQEEGFSNKDTICLSFYVTEDKLDLSEVTYGKQDIYFIYWLACLMPIYDAGGLYKKLIDENYWLLSQLPNWTKSDVLEKNKIKPRKTKIYRDIIDMFIGGIEPWAKKRQLAIMPEVLARAINYPSKAVVVSDKVLKLHVNDRREEYNRN